MRLLTIVAALLSLVSQSFQIESLEDVLVYPVEPATNIRKREVSESPKKDSSVQFKQFVEDTLIQHTKALEQLIELVQENEETTKQLLENLSNKVDQPNLPQRVEVHHQRSSSVDAEDGEIDHPLLSRRSSFPSKPVSVIDQPNTRISPWCSVALLCHRTYSPVCGYDENFGYGKFDDICHMLQVNCYWKYNFALVPSCRPVM